MTQKVIHWLIAIGVFDIFIPLPITVAIALYALIKRPLWFRQLCAEVVGPQG